MMRRELLQRGGTSLQRAGDPVRLSFLFSLLFLLLFLACALPASAENAAAPPTDFWAVRPWEMWAATPPYKKLCNSNGHCYSLTVVFPDRRIAQYQDNARYSVTAVLADGGVGVVRDFGDGYLRCFSDSRTSCEPARFPPGYSPSSDFVPVLSTPGLNSATPGAWVYYALETEQVNDVNVKTCAVSWLGEIVHSGAHFMLDSFDFGPPIGVLTNIYVTEEAMGCPVSGHPMACARLERYFFAPGLGRIRQEGWNDPSCDGYTPSTCLGKYSLAAPGVQGWIPDDGPPVERSAEICPNL